MGDELPFHLSNIDPRKRCTLAVEPAVRQPAFILCGQFARQVQQHGHNGLDCAQ